MLSLLPVAGAEPHNIHLCHQDLSLEFCDAILLFIQSSSPFAGYLPVSVFNTISILILSRCQNGVCIDTLLEISKLLEDK